MTQDQRYILEELKIIQRECMETGISASEWVERYAEEYSRNHINKSRWATWLERVNNT